MISRRLVGTCFYTCVHVHIAYIECMAEPDLSDTVDSLVKEFFELLGEGQETCLITILAIYCMR